METEHREIVKIIEKHLEHKKALNDVRSLLDYLKKLKSLDPKIEKNTKIDFNKTVTLIETQIKKIKSNVKELLR